MVNKTTETQKDIAIKCLETLHVFTPYIRRFKSANMPCFFERYVGFYADQEEKLYNKIKEVEADSDCIVYAVTHEVTDMGETWSMLCVPKDCSLDELLVATDRTDLFYAHAYVWNVTAPFCSEWGSVVIQISCGGIRRVD
jgi:hypothetical protein